LHIPYYIVLFLVFLTNRIGKFGESDIKKELENVKLFRNTIDGFRNRLIINMFEDGQKKTGTFRGEKRYFAGGKVPLFPPKSTASLQNQSCL